MHRTRAAGLARGLLAPLLLFRPSKQAGFSSEQVPNPRKQMEEHVTSCRLGPCAILRGPLQTVVSGQLDPKSDN
jgi:hypothetical protein